MKFCKDCKHYQVAVSPLFTPIYIPERCYGGAPEFDKVSGARLGADPRRMRERGSMCGEGAAWFQPKRKFWKVWEAIWEE